MTKELTFSNFNVLNEEEMMVCDGGLPIALIGACVIWGINAGLLTWTIRDITSGN